MNLENLTKLELQNLESAIADRHRAMSHKRSSPWPELAAAAVDDTNACHRLLCMVAAEHERRGAAAYSVLAAELTTRH